MSILQAIFLGALQGFTEFLPISSSGHLILVPELFGWPEQGIDFDIMMHVATLGAICVAFLPEIKRIAEGLLRPLTGKPLDAFGRIGLLIFIATIPAVLFGAFGSGFIDAARTPWVVIVSLAFWGVVLILADLYVKKRDATDAIDKVGWPTAILVGVAQAIALIPGTSRSGITISSCLFSGLDRDTAVRFSFLLSIPAIIGAGLMSGLDLAREGSSVGAVPLFAGFAAAFISGLLAISWLLALAKRANFAFFGVYRLILAVVAWFILF